MSDAEKPEVHSDDEPGERLQETLTDADAEGVDENGNVNGDDPDL